MCNGIMLKINRYREWVPVCSIIWKKCGYNPLRLKNELRRLFNKLSEFSSEESEKLQKELYDLMVDLYEMDSSIEEYNYPYQVFPYKGNVEDYKSPTGKTYAQDIRDMTDRMTRYVNIYTVMC